MVEVPSTLDLMIIYREPNKNSLAPQKYYVSALRRTKNLERGP